MHIRRPALALALTVTAVLASRAGAVDQTVRGKNFLVKDPKPGVDTSKRGIGVVATESASDDSLVGNPLANGATVEIIANGTNPTDQLFTLPAGAATPGVPGWKALGNPVAGYMYKDAAGANGPVKTALIKKAGNGAFIVIVNIKGALGPGPLPHITVVPPAPGTDGGMRFTIGGGGDTYCVGFGGAAGGKVINAPAKGTPNKLFKIVAPTAEACPSPASTTTTTTTTTSTTCPTATTTVQGALPPTVGRFNFNAQLGLPGANAACNTNFLCSQACTIQQLQGAPASELVGLKDINNNTVTSFWAIDSTAPILQQCNDDAIGGSGLNWEYGTAHTASRGEQVTLNNGTGALGPVVGSIQCNIAGTSWVGCCR